MSTLQIQTPRVFKPLLLPSRYKGAHGGRGSGKSHFFAELLIERCLTEPTRWLCCREIQKSIKESVKQLLEDKINSLEVSKQFVILETEIRTPGGGVISFAGLQNHTSDSIKSYEGYDGAWVEEAQTVSEKSLTLLRPTIRKENSELWFSWNPDQPTDPIDKLLRGKDRIKAVVVEANWKDNPWFPEVLKNEMEQDKKRNYDKYLHVWEGKYREIFEGTVYADEVRKAIEERRFTSLPYDATRKVETFWDIGWADYTSIWFAQVVGNRFHIIDFYQNRMKPLNHYLSTLQNKGYIYGADWLPHDSDKHDPVSGRTYKEVMLGSGRDVRVVPMTTVEQGIGAVRTIFNRCYFDEHKCETGIYHLKRYHYDDKPTPEGLKSTRLPVHDEHSHAADAFRYLALALSDAEPRRKLNYRKRNVV